MKTFSASSPDDRVAGASILAMLDALGVWRTRGVKILDEHGIGDPQAASWYSLQSYLDAMRFIYEKIGPATIADIGRKLVATNSFPPEIDSLDAALSTLDDAYRLRHRGHDIGYFKYARVTERAATMEIHNPYPCELDRGVVSALAKRFRSPTATTVHVEHESADSCRKSGAESCLLTVTW